MNDTVMIPDLQPSPLKVFEFEGGKDVRVAVAPDGETWFVAADVCANLDIENSRMAVARLHDDEKDVSIIDTPGGPQQMNVVNESGLYSLIFSSRKPEAERFRKWVTQEVLPALRKHGAYVMVQRPVSLQSLLRLAADEIDRVHKEKAKAERKLTDAEPKVAYYDRAMAVKSGVMTVRDTAQLLGTGQNRLMKFLRDIKWLQTDVVLGVPQFPPRGRHNVPFQRVIEAGYVTVKERTWTRAVEDARGNPHYEDITTVRVFITPSGRRRLAILLDEAERKSDLKRLSEEGPEDESVELERGKE